MSQTSNQVVSETNAASSEQQPAATITGIAALCERVRKLAESTAEHAVKAAEQQREAILSEATSQAQVEYQAQLAMSRRKLEKQHHCQMQNSRLEARTRIEAQQWDMLTEVLDQAERAILSLRTDNPDRFYAAMVQFIRSACAAFEGGSLLARANAADMEPLRERLCQNGIQIELIASDVAAGIVISTADGNLVIDQSLAARRYRLEMELRLAAREILFGDAPVGVHD